ncbi:ion channel [Natronospora cellulosivora (SeqCode)]
MKIYKFLSDYIIPIISPTYMLTDYIKNNPDYIKNEYIRSEKIIKLYRQYFRLSLILCILLLIPFFHQNIFLSIIFLYYAFSRVIEISLAFIIDSIDKMKNKPLSKKSISYHNRFILALKSYLELILAYGIIYFLIDVNQKIFFLNSIERLFNMEFKSILQAIYLSANTVTLLGYGDIYPSHISIELIATLQVISGVFLIIITFTIYVNLNFANPNNLNEVKRKIQPRSKARTIIQILIIHLIILALYII